MTYLVKIDEYECAAHGDCVDAAPDVFALDDVAHVIGIGEDAVVLAAAAACPSTAILVIDPRTNEQIYP